MSTAVKCPICKKPTSLEGNMFRPFCSERCKLIDLGAWAEEKYFIPSDELSDEDETDIDTAGITRRDDVTYH